MQSICHEQQHARRFARSVGLLIAQYKDHIRHVEGFVRGRTSSLADLFRAFEALTVAADHASSLIPRMIVLAGDEVGGDAEQWGEQTRRRLALIGGRYDFLRACDDPSDPDEEHDVRDALDSAVGLQIGLMLDSDVAALVRLVQQLTGFIEASPEALADIEAQIKPHVIPPPTDRATAQAQAIAALVDHPEWTRIEEVAGHVGVNRNTPYRWRRFMEAWCNRRAPR